MPVAVPQVGDLYEFTELTGYKVVQNRPFECRIRCSCGACNGTRTCVTIPVTEVIRWADNSIDVVGVDADGTRWTNQLVASHGDLC